MVAHQDKGVHPPTCPCASLAQSPKESRPVRAAHDRFAPVTPIQDMIERAAKFDLSFPCHRGRLPRAMPSRRAKKERESQTDTFQVPSNKTKPRSDTS